MMQLQRHHQHSTQQHLTNGSSSGRSDCCRRPLLAAVPTPILCARQQHQQQRGRHKRCQQQHLPSTQLRAARPEDAGSPAAADAAADAAQTDSVSKARQELVQSWQLLKDAAGTAFVPGYKQQLPAADAAAAAAAKRRQPLRYSSLLQNSKQQPQRQPQADVISIPDRLQRILTGQFIREREAAGSSDSSTQQQQVNPQFAAVQFEILQRMKKQQQEGQPQPQQQQQVPPQEAADKTAPAEAAAEATSTTATAAASAAVSVDPDGIIDVTPDIAQPEAAAAAAEQQTNSSQSATRDAGAAAAAEAVSPRSDFYPASTQVLVVCTWAVFLLQWAQALPALWGVLTGGGLLDAAAALLLAFPDTAVTHSMCLDMTALQQGTGWSGLLTSGLCNSGFVATWLCCAALSNCGGFLEAGTSQLQLLAVFLICTLAASAGHIFAGRCALGVTGPGAVLGLYTTWSILATQHLRDVVPLRTIYTQGLMLLAVLLALGIMQPAISAGSLLGGVLGGVLAVKAAGPCAEALRWCLAVPAMAGFVLLKLLLDLVHVLWLSAVLIAAACWKVVTDVVSTVRRL